VLKAAREVESQFQSFKSGADLLAPTMNIGMIRTFEDQIRVLGSCRLPPSVPEEIYQNWMKQLGEACAQAGATFRVRDYKKSFAVSRDSEFVKGLLDISKEMDLDASLGMIESATEASVFSRLGMECVVFGPGVGVGNSHAPNERVKLESLEKAVAFYKRAVERFCL
jgi:succinyl-diaminopimelate desuccinylase